VLSHVKEITVGNIIDAYIPEYKLNQEQLDRPYYWLSTQDQEKAWVIVIYRGREYIINQDGHTGKVDQVECNPTTRQNILRHMSGMLYDIETQIVEKRMQVWREIYPDCKCESQDWWDMYGDHAVRGYDEHAYAFFHIDSFADRVIYCKAGC